MKQRKATTSPGTTNAPLARRSFLNSIAQGAAVIAAGLAAAASKNGIAATAPGADRSLDQDKSQTGSTPWSNELSTAVQMQFMRPGQLEAAARRFPVVYVPFGLIEWHGRHLPLGNDALKAHAILVKCAAQVGGVVYPPVLIRYHRISASFGSKP